MDFAVLIIVSCKRQLAFNPCDQRTTLLLRETQYRHELYYRLRDAKNQRYSMRDRRTDLATFRDMMGVDWYRGYLPPIVPVELCRMED